MKSFDERVSEALGGEEPFLGHKMLPIPLLHDMARTERCSTYVELPLLRFFEEYKNRMGSRSVSEVIRRLAIIGAVAEGYSFDDKEGDK